jgi:predicted PurR-regulated permease PerM
MALASLGTVPIVPASSGDAAGSADPTTDTAAELPSPTETTAPSVRTPAAIQGLPARGKNLRIVDLDVQPVIVAIATMVLLGMIVAVATSGVLATLLVLAALFAFALDPVVDKIQQRFTMARGYAVGLMMGSVLLVIAGGIALLGPQTVDQARSFQQDLPHVLDTMKDLPLVGPTLVENQAPQKIQQWAAKLPKQLAGDTTQISNAAESITAILLDVVAATLIMIALLIDGPWLVSGAQRLIPPERRATSQRLGQILGQVIGRYFAGSLLLATLQGLQVLITGLVLGVPLSPLLAVWAAVWNLVPQVGGAIGGILFVLVAFTQGATTGVIAAAVFLLYITFANNVLLPVILGKAMNISPLATMVATIAGFSIAGIVGAMLAVPILGAGKAMYLELRPGRGRNGDLEDDPPSSPGIVQRSIRRVRNRGGPPTVPAPT